MLLHSLLEQIKRYLVGKIDRQDLERWLLSYLQVILDSGDRDTIHLANQVDGLFVELGEQIISEQAFRESLHNLTRRWEDEIVVIPWGMPSAARDKVETGLMTAGS